MENRDIEYFDNLWQDSKPKDGMVHNKETWDRMAQNWNKDGKKIQLKKDEKILKMKDLFIDEGILTSNSEVLDLGCGPGKYGIEFAKVAKSVTLSDVSPLMLGFAKDNAASVGIENVEYVEADFLTQSVEELGWEKKFDFVFTSLTPAMDSAECIEKINKCTRKWAFNNSFVYLTDSLRDEVKEKVFNMPVNSNYGNSSPYCIWNILWLMGCYPQITYYSDKLDHEYDLSMDTAHYIVEQIIRDRAPNDDEVKKTYEYLEKRFPDGKVIRTTESLMSWILWKVDQND